MADTRDVDPLARPSEAERPVDYNNGYPFELTNFDTYPVTWLDEVEKERISWLPEFADIFASDRLLMQAQEYFDGDLWTRVLNLVAARNEYRRQFLPDRATVEPGDQLYAAQFYRLAQPERAIVANIWDEIHAAARKRVMYMRRMESLLSQRKKELG